MPISALALICEIPAWSAESNFGQEITCVELFGVGVGLVTKALTVTPLSQINFLPLLMQVNFLPLTIEVAFNFVQVAPALAVAALACGNGATQRATAIKTESVRLTMR
jgi:hypothetical protein